VKEFEKIVGIKADEAQHEIELQRNNSFKKVEETKKATDWSPEELSALAKAIVKYPGGIPSRWKLIASFIESRT